MQIHKYLIGLVVGVLIMLAFFTKDPPIIYTPKVYVRRDVQADLDTLQLVQVDTILVAHPTPQGFDTTEHKLPVWKWLFDDSLALVVDDGQIHRDHLPFRLHVWGYVKRYDLETRPWIMKLEPRVDRSITMWKIGAIGFGIVAVALATKIIID